MQQTNLWAKQTGFSLLELALVLMIIALVLGGMLNPLGSLLEGRQRTGAETGLERIKEALVGFAVINGYLPCPTTATDPNSADYGLEDIGCSTDPTGEGYIPWRTLGVPEVDPWGSAKDDQRRPVSMVIGATGLIVISAIPGPCLP